MTIPFDIFYKRVLKATDITTQMALAEALGVNRSAITQAKARDAVPQKWILALSRRYTLSPDWLEFGAGTARPQKLPQAGVIPPVEKTYAPSAAVKRQPVGAAAAGTDRDVELVYVPKVRARLCAGGGSFEMEAIPVAEHPFPYQWLSRMGSPKSMVFMDVVGDSMEPGIQDGDMVLVDQSNRQIGPQSVLAVGLEDAIYLKRVEKRNDAILLHSDNNAYSDIEIYGDELDNFRVIGKVVWLCRDCRYWP